MTVYELIKELEKVPRDFRVSIADSDMEDDERTGDALSVDVSDYFDDTVMIRI